MYLYIYTLLKLNLSLFNSNGKPVDLPTDLQHKYEKCLDLLKINTVQRKLIEPFRVYGYDLFHAGKNIFYL